MHHATKLLRRIEAATEPFEGMIDNRRTFIKTPNGTWGEKVLINELVCLELAQRLNLPIPNGGICVIDDDTVIDDVIDDIPYDEDIKGICFYSERIEKSNPIVTSLNVVRNIVNKCDINRIVLFDHIIYNEDRHAGNILIQHSVNLEGFNMYIIDHSHVFNAKHNWNKEIFKGLMDKGDYKDTKIMELNNNSLYKTFFELEILKEEILRNEGTKFKKLVTKELLDDICNSIPEEWINDVEDIESLKEYILYRVGNIDYIIDIILSYKRGGV